MQTFLLGVQKGDILFPRKENIPLNRVPCTVQGHKALLVFD